MRKPKILRFILMGAAFCLCGFLLQAQVTHTVTNTNDNGAGTLRQAVLDATAEDIITFSNAILHQTITLTTTDIFLNKDLTIQGPGAEQLTISGGNNSRIFTITDSSTEFDINISGLTFSDGNGESSVQVELAGAGTLISGGAILNYSDNLTISSCIFTSNQVEYGGGISNFGCSPTISNCTYTGNTGNKGGGGILNIQSSPTINNSSFTSNEAKNGGSIYNYQSTIEISNCAFTENTANSTGGGLFNAESSLSVTNCTFTGNTANSSGGAMYNNTSSPSITSCIFTGNTSEYYGGGIYNSLYSNPPITNCTFTGNTATFQGGGMYNIESSPIITNCIIYGNSSPEGNEIYNSDYSPSIPQISHCDIAGCGGSGGSWVAAFGYDLGGNIDEDPLFSNLAFDVHLQSTSPCINTGSDASAPVTDLDGNPRVGVADMGAYEFQGAGTLIVTNTNDSGSGSLRQAVLDATSGAIIIFSQEILPGTITLTTNDIFLSKNLTIQGPGAEQLTISGGNNSRIFTITDSSTEFNINISGLTFSNGNGESTYQNNNGGAIYNYRCDKLNITNCMFNENSAEEYGGGIFNLHSSPIIANCTFNSNDAKYGAGMYNSYSSAKITNSLFTSNLAQYGGGINNFESLPTLTYCLFISNEVQYSGGGILNQTSSPTLTYCTFISNKATTSGGGIYNYNNSSPSLTNCTFTSNEATTSGGGICNNQSSPSSLPISNCTFSNNKAQYGGGIYNSQVSQNFTSCTFTSNESTIAGGGFYNTSCSPIITNCIFIGNKSNFYGGGGYNTSSSPNIINCTFIINEAPYGGGGICNQSAVPKIISCILFENITTNVGAEIFNLSASNPQVSHCNIAGCGGSGVSWNASLGIDLGGNIQDDPLFVTTPSDVHLQAGSPCINTGSDAAAPLTDKDGFYRCGTADIGAYEFQYDMTWNGSSDEDWNNTSNWDYVGLSGTPNGPPSGGTDVTIPTTANDPIINNPAASYAWVSGLTINSGAALTLQPGKCLTTEGPIINNGTMLLQSDATGTASLITNSDVNGNIIIQKNITDGTWHLIGIPVSSATASLFLNDYLQYYANGAWVEITNQNDALYPLKGYSLWGVAKNTTYTFTGTPNTGELSTPVFTGWNLLANPYPSAVNWESMDDTYGAMYCWDPTAGSYKAYVNGIGYASPILPAMQGFWINAQVDGAFAIDNEVRTHSDTDFYYKKRSQNSDPKLELVAFNDTRQDHFHFLFTDDASADFDLQYDAYKMLTNVDDVPQLFSISNGKRYSIDRRPSCESINLGFSCMTSGEFSIMIAETHLMPKAILEDTKTGTFHDLTAGAYSFAYLTDDNEDRFILHLSTAGIEHLPTTSVNIYSWQKKITIANLESNEEVTMSVYNTAGAKVLMRKLNGAQKHVISTTLPSGIYVAVLRSNSEVIKKKINIQ